MPRSISGWPNCAVSAARRSVHAMASSQPPPRANPLMAAMDGLPSRSRAPKTAWPLAAKRRAPSASSDASSAMSAPAPNARSPAPVSTSTRRPASVATPAISALISVSNVALSALSACGPVQRREHDRAVLLDQECFKGHGVWPTFPAARSIRTVDPPADRPHQAIAPTAATASAAPTASATTSATSACRPGTNGLVPLVGRAIRDRHRPPPAWLRRRSRPTSARRTGRERAPGQNRRRPAGARACR